MSARPAVEGLRDWTVFSARHESEHGRWEHTLALPPARLCGLVSHMWAVRGVMSCTTVRILPTASVEVMFTLGPPHGVLGEPATGRDVEVRHGWVSGLQAAPLTVASPEGTDLVGLALHPLGAWAFFGGPTAEISGRVVDLAELFPAEAPEQHARILSLLTAEQRLARLAAMLERRLEHGRAAHTDVQAACHLIERHGGGLRIRDVCTAVGVSNKLLIRRFREHLGTTPKAYARVLRFRHLVRRVRSLVAVDWAGVAAEHGYYDQPHFVHDFREFAGCTPGEYMRLRTPDGESVVAG